MGVNNLPAGRDEREPSGGERGRDSARDVQCEQFACGS